MRCIGRKSGACEKVDHAIGLVALEIESRKDNGDESLQTVGIQNSLAGNDRSGGDSGWRDAVLQSARSEPSHLHGYGRRRRLPGKKSGHKESCKDTDRRPLRLHIVEPGSCRKAEDATRS